MIKSGLFEFNQCTKSPAVMTPRLIITSLEVKSILACIWASLLLDFCSRYKQSPFAASARIETTIIVEKSGAFSVPINLRKTSTNPITANVI